jgi:S-formylglutathione hydrolase FrmB
MSLYYFHARNGNETWWNDKTYHTGKLYETWKKMGVDPPTVIAISFGKLWLLTENSSDPTGGLFNVLQETVIPTLERKVEGKTGKRMVAGISMGGLNTLMVSMKSEGFFEKAASICAPLAAVSPHDSLINIIRYYMESSTSLKRAYMLWKFSKQFYPTQEIWEQNDPIFLSKSFQPEESPELYVTCGAKDDWGCMKGSEIFVKNVEKAGGTIEWVPRPGGHCDIDYDSLARFLN